MLNMELKTERLQIRRFEQRDLEQVCPLFFDQEIMYYYIPDQVAIKDLTELRNYLSDWDDDESCFLFSCIRQEKIIAILSLEKYSVKHMHTELGIALIRREFHGQGYAREIVQTMIDYLFAKENLHKIFIRYIEGNEASKRLFHRLGFREEGCFKEQIKKSDRFLDLHYLSLFKRDWSPYIKCLEKN